MEEQKKEIMNIIRKIKDRGVINYTSIYAICNKENLNIDIEKVLTEMGYKEIDYTKISTDINNEFVKFSNIVKTTKKYFDNMLKVMTILNEDKTKVKYDSFIYYIKEDKPIFIIDKNKEYIGVIAPSIEK